MPIKACPAYQSLLRHEMFSSPGQAEEKQNNWAGLLNQKKKKRLVVAHASLSAQQDRQVKCSQHCGYQDRARRQKKGWVVMLSQK
ncbi:hypothetical protein OH492_19950 [Vibrio chagasii]|nr:hypothetical protein [Vibrio chagasii]